MLMKMFSYMSSNCSYSNLVFPSYVKEEQFYDLCKCLALILFYPVIVHTVFSIISDLIQLLVQQPTLWPVGYELIHILFNLKYFNPLGILRIHCGLFGLHKFCCLALFYFYFFFRKPHTHAQIHWCPSVS